MAAKNKTMKVAGAWNIAMGAVILTVSVAVGVGCLVSGGKLLKAASE